MAPDTPAVHPAGHSEYVEGPQAEDDSLIAARARAVTLGCPAVNPAVGAALRFLATVLRAKAVVEIGTGAGVSGLYLLRGMVGDGVLTSIDVEPEHQAAAKRVFAGAGIAPGRARLIMGRALDVLPRLTDGGYDLLFVDVGTDTGRYDYPEYHEQGVRLLRPGGVLAYENVLARDARDDVPREVLRMVRADDRLVPLLLPLGDGLLVAAKVG